MIARRYGLQRRFDGRRLAREFVGVLAGLVCGPVLREALDRQLGGSYPLFPYYVGAMIALAVAGPRAGLVTLVLAYGLEVALDGGGAPAVRVAVYWLAGLVPIALVRALGTARSRAHVLADEATARAGEARRWQALANTIIDSAPVGIGLYDKDCRFLRVNPALAAINGLSVEQHVGRGAWDLLPEWEPLVRETFERVIATAEPAVGVEIEGRTPASPDRRYWRMSIYPVRAGQDPAFAVAAVVEDVTGQRTALRRLRESEERYRSLLAASTAIVGVADADGRFVSPQPSWEAYTGQPWEVHRDYGYLGAIHPDDQERAVAISTAARTTGTPYASAARLWHAPSGTYRHCRARVVPVRNPDGTVREWVSSIIDVHEVVLAEDALRASEASFREMAIENARLYEAERRSRAEAEAANRAKDDFLSLLSHELRTPLTAVLSWVRLLREGRVKVERVDAALATVERSGWALTRIVDDLLDVSRIVTGRTRLEVRTVELGGVLDAAAATIKPTADAKQVRLDVRLQAEGVLVAGDPDRLQQVVWNLLTNAVRFTPAGGSVELRLAADARTARIVVADRGAGILPELLPYVFDRFWQGPGERRHGGLGLGLAIVRHFVELHGGTVRAESAGEGCGATFTIDLPVVASVHAGMAAGEVWRSA